MKKFEIWLDSGANIHSKRKVVRTLDDLGLSDDDWLGMSEEEQDDFMREEAFAQSDWGYKEVENEP